MSITVTASTSVLLVDTQFNSTIVFMPNISSIGRLITIRDNTGFCTTNSSIILSTTAGASFAGPTVTGSQSNRLTINQPFGFLTLSMAANGQYNLINTFAFSSGQSAAVVSQLTTSNILLDDLANTSFWPLYASNANLYFISTPVGQVTNASITSTINGLGQLGYLSSLLPPPQSILVTTGLANNGNNPIGTIKYSLNGGSTWLNATGGFNQYGKDVAYANNLFVACGYDNPVGASFTNTNIQYSVDGRVWQNANISLPVEFPRSRVAYNNGLWHCLGEDLYGYFGLSSNILWSPDGINWNPSVTNTIFQASGTGITYGAGVWVVSLFNSPSAVTSILWSSDGSNWNNATTVSWTQGSATDVSFDGTRFVAYVLGGVNGAASNLATSLDGKNWTSVGLTGGNFNNASGYLTNGVSSCVCGTPQQNTTWLVTPTLSVAGFGQGLKRSLDGGLSWQSNANASVNLPNLQQIIRPYWDGNKWWAGFQFSAPTSNQGFYYSLDDGQTFQNTGITGGFSNDGFAYGFAATPGIQSDYGFQLQSTVFGLSQSFATQSFQATTISAATMTVSSLIVQVEITSTTFQNIDIISSLFVNTLSSGSITTSNLNFAQGIKIGSNAGIVAQASDSVAIGNNAGSNNQGIQSVAIGPDAGSINQGSFSVALGDQAGQSNQSTFAIAIGSLTGMSNQGPYTTAIGNNAGRDSQKDYSIAIGYATGTINQSSYSVAVGFFAGYSGQDKESIAIGHNAGGANQGSLSIGIGSYAGQSSQSTLAVALGPFAGQSNQQDSCVAVGNSAGFINQAQKSVGIGNYAAYTSQGNYSVAMGYRAGSNQQGNFCVAIGVDTGVTGQLSNSVAIGNGAGSSGQKQESVAIGFYAGLSNQGYSSVAIGKYAGSNGQDSESIGIGNGAGGSNQSTNAIAIGNTTGIDNQGAYTIAIGTNAGNTSQGIYSIAIGKEAGSFNQHDSTIILNATGSALLSVGSSRTYVKPVRFANGVGVSMNYDAGSGEITYGTASDSNLKQNIQTARDYIDDLERLRLVTFEWKENPTKRFLGVIAQEVQEIFPSAITSNPDGYLNIDPTLFTYLNTNAIQSMYSTQKALVSQVQSLTADVSTLLGLK